MRGVVWVCAVSFLLFSVIPCSASEFTNEEDALILEHDLGLGTFSHRAKIQLPNARRKEAEILSQAELEGAELDNLSAEGKQSHGLYRVRVKDQANNATMVIGYTDARRLKDAGLRDVVTVFSDDAGNVVSVSIRPRTEFGANDFTEFSTILLSQTPTQAPMPDTAAFLNKVKEEKLRKEKAENEPQSFLAKYWMYIVPVVFLFMMSNANQQQGS